MSRLHNGRPGLASPCGARDGFQLAIMTGRRVAAREVADPRAGHSGAVVLRAGPGIGKTVLLACARVGCWPGGPARREVSW